MHRKPFDPVKHNPKVTDEQRFGGEHKLVPLHPDRNMRTTPIPHDSSTGLFGGGGLRDIPTGGGAGLKDLGFGSNPDPNRVIPHQPVQDPYLTTWPDTWPEDLKEQKKAEWLFNHKDMKWQTVYGLLMQDGPYPWYGINTLVCEAPLDPETCADPEVFRNWTQLVAWNGAYVAWAMDARVTRAGVIKQSDIDYKFNRYIHCPLLQTRLKAAAAEKLLSKGVDKIGLGLAKVGDTYAGILDMIKGNAKYLEDNPSLSIGAIIGLGALAIIGASAASVYKK